MAIAASCAGGAKGGLTGGYSMCYATPIRGLWHGAQQQGAELSLWESKSSRP